MPSRYMDLFDIMNDSSPRDIYSMCDLVEIMAGDLTPRLAQVIIWSPLNLI
jgi:hypothetical protein